MSSYLRPSVCAVDGPTVRTASVAELSLLLSGTRDETCAATITKGVFTRYLETEKMARLQRCDSGVRFASLRVITDVLSF